jgi:hypothetical protein
MYMVAPNFIEFMKAPHEVRVGYPSKTVWKGEPFGRKKPGRRKTAWKKKPWREREGKAWLRRGSL